MNNSFLENSSGTDKRILITGGHAGSTAYALIQEIKERSPAWKIVFVGSKYATEGSKIKTLENTYFPKLGIKYISLISGRLQRRFTIWTIPALIKIPIGFIQSALILMTERPDIIVSFGGFTAFPVVVMGKLFRIPIIIHEQTMAVGRSNITSAFFAEKIAVSRSESKVYFPAGKCVLTGNPISKEIVRCAKKSAGNRKRAILITGGSRGSLTLNAAVEPIISILLKKYKVFHQTGERDFDKFKALKNSLGNEVKGKYEVFATVEMGKWYEYLRDSDILVSRSGANIVSESIQLRMPSIFIPLPFAYKDEQYKNAKYSKDLGLSEIIRESDLSSENLYETIEKVSESWDSIIKNSKSPAIDDSKASFKLYTLIFKTLVL